MPNGRNRHHDENDVLRRTSDPNVSEHNEPVTLTDVVNPDHEREEAMSAGVIHPDDTSLSTTSESEGWSVDVGIDVVGSCGHKIGEVVDVRDDCLVVEKGFFIPEDLYVPKSAISDADKHHLKLKVTKEAVDHSDWDEDPDERIDVEPFQPQQRRAS